jgi:[CysO sulfur-carrier protein]-S-L-cysteine hydrolase
MGLTLSSAQYAAILEHVETERPNEACGLLAGTGEQVDRVYAVENIHHSPTTYEMNPAQQVAAFLEIEAAGWELRGIYHSHPAGPAEPSPTDIAQAFYPESVYLIVSQNAKGEWQMRGFSIEAGQAREAPVHIREQP